MKDGGPALKAVMSCAVKDIGRADGQGCPDGLNGGEEGTVVDSLVVEKRFLEVFLAKLSRGKVVERSGRSHA